MKNFLKLFAVVSVLNVSVASADPLMQYDYLDVAYQWTHFDQDEIDDANGLDTKFSMSPTEYLALEAGYNYAATGALGTDVALNTFGYGIAGWYDFCQNFHLVGRVGGLHQDLDVDGDLPNDAEDGVYTGAQLRYLFTDTFEGDFDVTYIHLGGETTWNYGLTGLFTLTDGIALKVGSAITDESDVSVLGGLRFALS
jgi:hypothetical protein